MAGEWEVVSERPASEWDVVSVEPAPPKRTGAAAIPTEAEAAGQQYVAPAPRAADTRSMPRRGLDELRGAFETVSTVLSALPTSIVGMGAEAFLGPEAGKKVMEAGTFVPRTPEGQRNVEALGAATENLPAFIPAIAPISGVAASLSKAGMARGAEVAGARVSRAVDAVTPTIDPGVLKSAGKAVDAGIPLAPHMLTENKFARLAGEAAEKIPFAGGKGKQRQAAFNAGLAKAIDPDTKATKLTPEVFAELQDRAGSTIGDISARTPVPADAFGDLTAVARRETPDVQGVIKAYADDFATVAGENGGVVPGEVLRKLRTEAQAQARTTSNGDLRRTLGNFVAKIDDALTEHAAPGDMDALLDARRRYAISTVLEPLVAKSADGDISPAALMQRVVADKAGKRRMARGKGGELGDYARIGQQFLKELATSNTAERNITYKVLTDTVTALKAVTAYPFAASYNLLGPRAAKWMVERQRRRTAVPNETPPPPVEPTLAQGFEPPPTRGGPASPLGDLVPDWETVPGAGVERPPGMSAEGLVSAVGDDVVTTGPRKDLRAGLEIPAVEGRPDLPDTMPVGGPAEVAGTPRAISAMDEPGAIEARRQQGMAESEAAAAAQRAEPVPVGEATEIKPQVVEPAPAPVADPRLAEIDRLKAATQSDAVRAALDKRAAAVKKEIKAVQEAEKKAADAAEMRALAEQTDDPGIKKALLAEADKMAKEEKIPVGEATEIKPEPIEPEAPNAQRLRTDDLQPEAGKEGLPEGGAGAQAGKGAGEEGQTFRSLSGFPEIDEGFMREQQRVQEVAKPSPPMSARGLAAVRSALEEGVAAGKLDKDGVSLALWALDRNPNLAKGLKQEGLQVEIAPHAGARGAYNDARELIRLVEGNTDGLTAAHELLHHAERMMPPKMQAGIRREWRRAVQAEIRNVAPLNLERADALKLALRAMEDGDATAAEAMVPYFKNNVLDRQKDYRLVNPTEFWAENASEILHGRFSGRGSWRAEAVQWLKEMIEHLKGTVGLRSDAPILKALDEILNPAKTTGERKSKNMITGSGRRDQPAQPQAP